MSKDTSIKKIGNRLNLRDFSLYRNEDGYRLKPDCFYRSRSLNDLKQGEIEYFEKHHLETILDLRNEKEIHDSPDASIAGTTIKIFSLFPVRESAIEEQEKMAHHRFHLLKLAPLYDYLVSDETSIQALKEALHFIFKEEHQGSILWHCGEGKDRAGILSMLFLSALDYPKDVIYDDYLFSNITMEKKAKDFYIKTFFKTKSFHLARGTYNAYIADKSYLENAYLSIYTHYGSIANYLKEAMRLEAKDIEAFKNKYMVKDDSSSR